jgi:hypothetical protein
VQGLLLINFAGQDALAVAEWVAAMDASCRVWQCPAGALGDGSTLGQILGNAGAGAGDEMTEAAATPGAPAIFFSGLGGDETAALVEVWTECTGLAAPAFASAAESLMDRPLGGLVQDILRAEKLSKVAGASQQEASGFMMVNGEAGPQEMDLEALRSQLQSKVASKRRAKAGQPAPVVDAADADATAQALRRAKRRTRPSSGGFG